MFTLLKLRHRALGLRDTECAVWRSSEMLDRMGGKITGYALWSVAGENENQPLDTHHPDRETVLHRGSRHAAPLPTGAGDWLTLMAATSTPPSMSAAASPGICLLVHLSDR